MIRETYIKLTYNIITYDEMFTHSVIMFSTQALYTYIGLCIKMKENINASYVTFFKNIKRKMHVYKFAKIKSVLVGGSLAQVRFIHIIFMRH